jgi:putative ABC transport system ATP-binding protein
VTKSYRLGERRVEALRGVDLTIDTPGFYAIMGASGSGKSTLLHLLGALDAPDAGVLEIGGKRLDGMGDRELTEFRRRGVGIVFQQFNLIPTMTAVENVELPGMLAGEAAKPLRDRAERLLDRLGVADRAGHRPEALSGGEQQRVAIARALLFSPPVLLADEPTGNLDSASSEKLWSLLAELGRSGVAAGEDDSGKDVPGESNATTVIMVTHEPAAAAHCQTTYLLRDGRMSGSISTEHLDAADVAVEYQRLSRSA